MNSPECVAMMPVYSIKIKLVLKLAHHIRHSFPVRDLS
jgi:hypothetical protein